MALIECIECGKEISDQAASCPHCGYRDEESVASEPQNVEASDGVKPAQTDPFAVATFAAGMGGLLILPILFIPVGYICAIVSYYKLKDNPELKGGGLRIAGAILTTLNILYLLFSSGLMCRGRESELGRGRQVCIAKFTQK